MTANRLGPLQLALAGLLIVTVSRIHDYVRLIGLVRPGLLLFVFVVLYSGLLPKSVDLRRITAEAPSRLILALIAVYFISSVTGLSFGSSITFFLDVFSQVLTLFVLLIAATHSVRQLRFFATVYVSGLLFIVYVTFFLGEVISYDGYTRVGGTSMYDGNDIGVLYAVGLPLAVALVQCGGSQIQRLIGIAALIGIPGSLALTASRGGFLGLIAVGLGLLFLAPGLSVVRRIAIVSAVAIGLAVFAPTGYWQQMSSIASLEDDYNMTSPTGRITIWKRGLTYVAQYPVFGVGPNNFIRAGWMISEESRSDEGIRDQAAHNSFLQVWAEMGTVGLLLVVSAIVGGSIQLLRLRRRLPRSWMRADVDRKFVYLMTGYIPVSLIGYSVAAFFVTHAYLAHFYMIVAFSALSLNFGKRFLAEDRQAVG